MTGCPTCGSELRGEPISDRHFVHNVPDNPDWDPARNPSCEQQVKDWGRCHCLPYGDKDPEDRFYSRMMGYEIQGVYDGVLFWGCEDCGHLWPRFSAESWGDLHSKALELIERIMAERAT